MGSLTLKGGSASNTHRRSSLVNFEVPATMSFVYQQGRNMARTFNASKVVEQINSLGAGVANVDMGGNMDTYMSCPNSREQSTSDGSVSCPYNGQETDKRHRVIRMCASVKTIAKA